MIHKLFSFVALTIALLASTQLIAQKKLIVKAKQPTAEVQPTMWGIFFEDINFAADGGLYAELVKNRSFEFFKPMMGWTELKEEGSTGSTQILNQGETQTENPRFARVAVTDGNTAYGLQNAGFRGMGIKKDMKYHFYVNASQQEGSNLTLRIQLVDSTGQKIGETTLKPKGSQWKEYEATLTATATVPNAKLNIWFDGTGSIDLDMISLFPDNTWKNRPKGLRADLVQLLADMNPGFLRFPGGCIVEGRELSTRYQWKKTVGDIDEREMIVNRWNTEFSHRLTPDYFQTFGLGFFEYFQLAEDLEAEPLPILSCGIACQFNTGELVPLDQLDPYVQDALDLIEFANGATDSKWGKLRADMGHPEPFNLKFIGVGNEQWGPQYIERYKVFAKAIEEKYPDMIIVSGTGPFPDGEEFDYAARQLKELNAEIVDEHYYRKPEWFLENADRYDDYDRDSYKIFAGEYAAQSVAIASPDNKNNWLCALSEAAFMTGLERNADVVHLTSYAPLFAHVDGWQWTPDLIWFNNLESYGTPNYYVQKLFATHAGSKVIPILHEKKPLIGQDSLYASAVIDEETEEIILKVVNVSNEAQDTEIAMDGVKKLGSGTITVLKSDNLNAVNSLDKPKHISPVEEALKVSGKKVNLSLAPHSLSVIRVKML